MFCPVCGAQNPDGSFFCSKCGYSLKAASFDAKTQGDTLPRQPAGLKPDLSSGKKEKKKKPKKKSVTVICIIVIAALIAGCAGWFGYGCINDKNNAGSICTVTFDMNADEAEISCIPDQQSVEYGQSASCPAYPVRYGYVFGGWYTNEECTKEYNFSKAVKEDLTLYAAWLDPDSEEAKVTDEEYEDYIECLDEIYVIYSEYVSDETGYVDEKDHDSVISDVETLVKEYEESGVIAFYSTEDETVYMEFSSLMVYVFSIPEEGMDSDPTDLSGTVCFPYYGEEWANDDSDAVDEREDEIVQTTDEFGDLTIMFADVSCIEGFDYAAGTEMFIWHGHGGFSENLGEQMATSDLISSYPDSLNTYIAGTDDTLNEALSNKSIVGVGVGHDPDTAKSVYAITSYYVENYFPEMDDAIVYLATCMSGYTSQLADAFISKGAEVVIANAGTESINTEYNQTMIKEVFSLMSGQDEEESGYLTVSEALDVLSSRGYAKSFSKVLFATSYQDAYPQIFYAQGNSDAANYTLYSALMGTLSLPDGVSAADVMITLENPAEGTTWYAIPEEDGNFSFNKLDGGDDNTYVLEVSYNGTVLYTGEELTLLKHRRTDIGTIAIGGIEIDIYVTGEDGEDISEALVSLTDEDGNIYSASLSTDDSLNYVYKTTVMPGEYKVEISCDGYESVSGSISVAEDALVLSYELEKEDMDIPEDAVEYGGHHYYIYDIGNDIEAAIEYCESLGGHMATITSSGENDFLYDYMLSNDLESVYFGFSDAAEEGTWIWLNGESVSYTNWHSTEPNSENDDEDYAMFYWKYDDGTWNDGDFGTGGTNGGGCAFICEWDG